MAIENTRIDRQLAQAGAEEGILWYDVALLAMEGKGWTDTETPFDRLPARAKAKVRPDVWGLSQDSAGLCVRFVTDAGKIMVRWQLRRNMLAMDHMPATGVSGVDLYLRLDSAWRWHGIGRPTQLPENTATLCNLPDGERQFMLYFPLYNGLTSLRIGIPGAAFLARAPAYPAARAKPVVFYGTSIVQGGCAARPGMAYTALLGRYLDRPAINLGFSGNGPMDLEMAELMAELDPAAYVLDGLPNMGPDQVKERAEPFVRILRQSRPGTPVVLVENIIYQNTLPGLPDGHSAKNAFLRDAYERLVASGIRDLHYVPCDDLLGHDWEGTVDGCHPTDVGFLRMAQALLPVLRPLLR